MPTSQEVTKVIHQQFGVDVKEMFVGIEVLTRDTNPEVYDRLRSEFESALQGRADANLLRKCRFFGPDYAVFLEFAYPRSEIDGLSNDLAFYYPICTREEISRIENPTTPADYLLTVRANEIADNARLQRVFLRRRERAGENWSLTSHFDRAPFEEYLLSISDEKRLQCERIEAGFAFLLEANGTCIRSPFGDVIVISETLKEYLFFMNVFLLTQNGSIPSMDSVHALLIAARIMLTTESPDFDIDPRGAPPEPHKTHCTALAYEQMQFVIGHEYAHHLLGHLGAEAPVVSGHEMLPGGRSANTKIYSRRQEQEFQADIGALLDPELSDGQLAIRLNAASWFFLGLDLWRSIKDFMAPPIFPSTHPSPQDRLMRLRDSVLTARNLDPELVGTAEEMRNNFDRVDHIKDYLCNKVLPLQIEELERYGSMYLPSYRPEVLLDRIDF